MRLSFKRSVWNGQSLDEAAFEVGRLCFQLIRTTSFADFFPSDFATGCGAIRIRTISTIGTVSTFDTISTGAASEMLFATSGRG